jgi:hypothetical protein
MEERYPFIRSVTGTAEIVAGAIALIVFLGGTMAACEQGGFGGFVSFVLTLLVTGLAYVAAMVTIESLRLRLNIAEQVSTIAKQLASRRTESGGEGSA